MPSVKYLSAPLLDCSTCFRTFVYESAGLRHTFCPHCGANYLPSWPNTPHDE